MKVNLFGYKNETIVGAAYDAGSYVSNCISACIPSRVKLATSTAIRNISTMFSNLSKCFNATTKPKEEEKNELEFGRMLADGKTFVFGKKREEEQQSPDDELLDMLNSGFYQSIVEHCTKDLLLDERVKKMFDDRLCK